MILDIELLSEKESRDCMEDFIASIASWWGREYALMYAESWDFNFFPRDHLPADTLGSRITPRVTPTFDLLRKYHGMKFSQSGGMGSAEVLDLVQSELSEKRPVILGRSQEIPIEDGQNDPFFIMVTGIDGTSAVIYYLRYRIDAGSEGGNELERMPVEDLKSWCDSCTTVEIEGEEAADVDWRKIIESTHVRLNGSSTSGNVFNSMRCFADEVRNALNIEAEVKGYPNLFFVPLFNNLMRISHGRVQFARLLQHLFERYQVGDLRNTAADLEGIGREWNLIRSLFIKSSFKPGDKKLLGRISTRIDELASQEKELAFKLLQVSKKREIRTHGPAVSGTAERPEKTLSFRRRFPRPELEEPYVAPRNKTEESLAYTWQDVLCVEEVGVLDNFFELGGDSLLIIQAISKARQLGLQLTAKQFFEHQTIAELAGVQNTDSEVQADQGTVTGYVHLLPFQRRGLGEFGLGYSLAGNVAIGFGVPYRLSPVHLEQTMRRLLAQHDALRLRFTQDGSDWRQFIVDVDEAEPACKWVDLSKTAKKDHQEVINDCIEKIKTRINLEKGPVIYPAYFELGGDEPNLAVIVVNHLVTDALSNQIITEDFQMICRQLLRQEPVRLPDKTTSVKYWGECLAEYTRSELFQSDINYWLNLPWDQIRPLTADYYEDARVDYGKAILMRLTLGAEKTRILLEVPRTSQTNLHQILLACLARTVAQLSGSNVVLIENIYHGREPVFEDIDLSRTVGFFSMEVPLVLDLRKVSGPGDTLKTVKEQIRRIPRGGIGYSLLRHMYSDLEIRKKLEALALYQARYNAVIELNADEGSFESGSPQEDWLLESIEAPTDPPTDLRNNSPFKLSTKVWIDKGQLKTHLGFGYKGQFEESTMAGVTQTYAKTVDTYINYLQGQGTGRA